MGKGLSLCMLVIFASFLMIVPAAGEPIGMGETFPEVSLPTPPNPEQRAYLGLPDKPTFSLDQVTGRVVLVEMLNVLCPHCVKQTVPYNVLYRKLESDPATRGQVKMLGVAIANSDEQIDDFVVIYDVAFPVVSDRRFALHRAVRGGPTPFSIYLLRDAPGETGVVAGTHLGEDHDMDSLFDYIKYLLNSRTTEFTALTQGKETPPPLTLNPPQTEDEIGQMIKTAIYAQGSELQDFRRLDLPSGRRVYAASIERNGRREPVFAEVASRSAICDVCHNVHFFYLFDRHGTVLAFEPLHLTKYGNVEWNSAELTRFAGRVVGKPLVGNWDFDPELDAVTSATMTSAIIFDSLDQAKQLLEELRAQGLL